MHYCTQRDSIIGLQLYKSIAYLLFPLCWALLFHYFEIFTVLFLLSNWLLMLWSYFFIILKLWIMFPFPQIKHKYSSTSTCYWRNCFSFEIPFYYFQNACKDIALSINILLPLIKETKIILFGFFIKLLQTYSIIDKKISNYCKTKENIL